MLYKRKSIQSQGRLLKPSGKSASTIREDRFCGRKCSYVIGLLTGFSLLVCGRIYSQHGRTKSGFLLSLNTATDDEFSITHGRLVHEDSIPPSFGEQLVACMPTVSRDGVEYVSNAVKSWRLATNRSTVMRRLIVFNMDENQSDDPNIRPAWVNKVFNVPGKVPSWLSLVRRERALQRPRKQTHGDSSERISWRSKEAQDYAEVIQRCAEMAPVRYTLIVQDDVLFTPGFQNVVQWADAMLQEREYVDEKGRTRKQRICSGSLFDVASSEHSGLDAHTLDSSNMVARLWPAEMVPRVARYISLNFDEAPVDWLADDLCRLSRRVTLVMEPNVVRHRGAVSSFAENKREGLLT